MKSFLFVITFIILSLILTGCTEELENISNEIDDAQYIYPDSKEVIVTLDEYNQLKSGMSENEVWDIIGGQCTNIGTTDLGIGSQYVTISYGCNGNGSIGSNVILMFQGGKLNTMSQTRLK